MGFFHSITHGISHGLSSITHIAGGIFSKGRIDKLIKAAHLKQLHLSGPLHKLSGTALGVAKKGQHLIKGAAHEVKEQVNDVKGLEHSVVGGVKGISKMLSSPIFLVAAAAAAGYVVLKK